MSDDVFYHVGMIMNIDPAEVAKIVHSYIERGISFEYDRLNCPKPPIYIGPVKVKSLKERKEEATMHEDCYFCIKRDICTKDVPKPCRYSYTEDQRKADQASDIYGAILAGMYLPKTYQKKKEETKMEATSTETFHDIIAIDFELQTFPDPDVEDKFIVSATNRDDIFCFVFEGPDLQDACRNAGLFTGWEKDQKIRELENQNKKILDTNKKLQEKIFCKDHTINELEKELSEWKKEAAECLVLRDKAVEEAKEFKKQLNQEKAANNAYHRFFKKYAGEGTELELTYISGSRNNADVETEYMIIDKEEYKKEEQEQMELRKNFIKEVELCTKLRSEIIELEKLKTPTIENFADEEPSSRRDILRCAEKCVCGQREQDYGTPESNFQLIADLWNGYLGGKTDNPVISVTAVDVAMMMSLLKIARIRNGGGSGDSFVDLAGYAACGGELWHSKRGTNIGSN